MPACTVRARRRLVSDCASTCAMARVTSSSGSSVAGAAGRAEREDAADRAVGAQRDAGGGLDVRGLAEVARVRGRAGGQAVGGERVLVAGGHAAVLGGEDELFGRVVVGHQHAGAIGPRKARRLGGQGRQDGRGLRLESERAPGHSAAGMPNSWVRTPEGPQIPHFFPSDWQVTVSFRGGSRRCRCWSSGSPSAQRVYVALARGLRPRGARGAPRWRRLLLAQPVATRERGGRAPRAAGRRAAGAPRRVESRRDVPSRTTSAARTCS